MHKVAFLIFSTLVLGCAGQKPPPVSLSDNQNTKSPFYNTAEEEIFWAIIAGDVTHTEESHNIDYLIARMLNEALFKNDADACPLLSLQETFDLQTWEEVDAQMIENILNKNTTSPMERMYGMRDYYHGRKHAQTVLDYVLYHPRLQEIIYRKDPTILPDDARPIRKH